jgi:hypothetical protein
MARPKKRNIDYFPHDCHPNRYLNILMSKYGNIGYAVYFRLNEVLGKTENHTVFYKKPFEKEYLASETGVQVEELDEILSTMVEIEYLDQELWESSQTIWSDEFIYSISTAYDNRSSDIPTKYSFQKENPGFLKKNPQSKEKKRKGKKSKEKESKSEALLSFDKYQELFPDKDLKDSFKKLLDMNGKAKHDDAMKWFEREKKLKKMTFQKTKSGLFKAWCSKCNAKSFPNDVWQLKRGSECHSVEYVNEPIK